MLKKFSRFSILSFYRHSIVSVFAHVHTRWSINTWLCNERAPSNVEFFFFFFLSVLFILDTYPSFGTGFTDYENNSREIDLQLRSIKILFWRIVRNARSKDLCKLQNQMLCVSFIIGRALSLYIYIFFFIIFIEKIERKRQNSRYL